MRTTLLALVLVAPLSGSGAVPAPEVTPGFDWSLPASCAPVPYSGFVTWNKKRFHPAITVAGVFVRWKDCNPAPGVYDWQPVLKLLEANRAAGMRTGLHLKGVERPGVPD